MKDIQKKIKIIRPSLRLVAPWTFNTILFYSIFNILVGSGLYFSKPNIPFRFFAVGVISIWTWGLIFILLGLSMIIALAVNNWQASKNILLAAIGIKTVWLAELIAQATSANGSPFIIFLWTLVL